MRKTPKADIAARVTRALEMVRLEQFKDRKPAQLSGGQQQRVALARALVFEPTLVLMDEPLGALDKKLREHMQIELKQIHEMLGVTIVYVTHDQSEALTMSDRVAIFESGDIAQIGTPDGLYNEPATAFVASFIGENNALDGIAERVDGGRCLVALPTGLKATALAIGDIRAGAPVHLTIRPERIGLSSADGQSDNRFQATVDGRIYHGDHQRLLARLANGQVLTVKVGPEATLTTGEAIELCWPTSDCRAFPAGAVPDGKSTNTGSALMTRAYRTTLLALASAAIICQFQPASAEELTVMATGGAWQAALRQAWFEPFAKKMGITFNEQEYTGELGKIKAMVETGNVPIDLVTVETSTVLQGCDAGVLIRLDYSKVADRLEVPAGHGPRLRRRHRRLWRRAGL